MDAECGLIGLEMELMEREHLISSSCLANTDIISNKYHFLLLLKMSVNEGKWDILKCNVNFPTHQLAHYRENICPATFPSNSIQPTNNKKRRKTVPHKPAASNGLKLWAIIRNCIGKDLTRIPLPVNFNEPLSMLQRITEDMEYSYLLDRASEKSDVCERLAYVGAFAVSCYSTTAVRTAKPFNPLLGETFEFDRREDLGWRSLAEQVSHHPPAAAQHAEGVGWAMYQDFVVNCRFRGTQLNVTPTGFTHIEFKDGKAACFYQKVTTTVHNLIVGKLKIDNHGEMTIVNNVSGERALIKFHTASFFSSNQPKKVEGLVMNGEGEPRFFIEGNWDNHINIAPVVGEANDHKMIIQAKSAPRRIWTVNPPIGDESMYHFSRFAMEMNEFEEAVAPTDSRRRLDQRMMEEGKWNEANKMKNQLEEKQRNALKHIETDEAEGSTSQSEAYHPRWFRKIHDTNTGSLTHVILNDEYWKCKERKDWSRSPDIF